MNRRKFQKCIVLLSIMTFWCVRDANAQGADTYQFTAVSGTYTGLTGGTAFAAVQQDDACPAATIPLGFTFNFCGVDYTTIRAASNGYMTFSTATANTLSNTVSNLNVIKPSLMWLWDDLDGGGGIGAASYATSGTAPDRVFTMEFKDWQWNWGANAAVISVQVKLYETTNLIEYIYRQEAAAGNPAGSSGASIGIADGAATATFLSLNNATAVPAASSATFVTNIKTKPASGQIYRFKPTPAIDIQMDSVIVLENFCSNASSPVSVAISNRGTATIDNMLINWEIDGISQTPVAFNAPTPIPNFITAPDNTAIVTMGDVFFADNTPKVIKAWIVEANGLSDEVNTNDTVIASKAANLTGVIVNIDPQEAIICDGSQITLDAGTHPKNPVYIWANGHVTQTIQVSIPGSYDVKVQNTDGCFDMDTVFVSIHMNPEVHSIAVVDNADGSYTFNAVGAQNVDSYIWDFGDGQTLPGTGIPGQVIHQYNTAGDYTVKLTVKNGNDCGEATVTRVIYSYGITTGLNSPGGIQSMFSIYPNPSRSSVTISGTNGIKIRSVSVLNIVGQEVLLQDNIHSDKFRFSVSDLASGIYNVIIDSDKGRTIKKLEIIQ